MAERVAFHAQILAEEKAAREVCDRVLKGPSGWWGNARTADQSLYFSYIRPVDLEVLRPLAVLVEHEVAERYFVLEGAGRGIAAEALAAGTRGTWEEGGASSAPFADPGSSLRSE